MDIRTIWQEATEYKTFTLELASSPDKKSFLAIKGCRLAEGPNGQFISGPSQKKQDGTYFNLTFFSREFNEAALEKALASQPKPKSAPKRKDDAWRAAASDDKDLPPF